MKFGFYSCMTGMPWGGSEELWWLTARQLQGAGHSVCVNYKWWPEKPKRLEILEKNGASVFLRERVNKGTLTHSVLGFAKGMVGIREEDEKWLAREKPDTLLITLGYHADRVPLVDSCIKMGIPYTINVQCASHNVFYHSRRLEEYRKAFCNAAAVYVVSEENLEKIETNIACELKNAELVSNPFNVPVNAPATWPEDDSTLRLACLGRIHFVSKGQDLLVQVLRRDKWRDRNISVTLFGKDQGNEQQLKDMIARFGLEEKIKLGGFSNDLQELWQNHHGLVLPSRYEGAALVIAESMLCHRLAITTDTGRNKFLIDDNVSGFIAPAATADLLDEAMERAWNRRHEWREIGLRAGVTIRERFNLRPVDDFRERLEGVASRKTASVSTTPKVAEV